MDSCNDIIELYYKHILLKSGYYYFQFDISINF